MPTSSVIKSIFVPACGGESWNMCLLFGREEGEIESGVACHEAKECSSNSSETALRINNSQCFCVCCPRVFVGIVTDATAVNCFFARARTSYLISNFWLDVCLPLLYTTRNYIPGTRFAF